MAESEEDADMIKFVSSILTRFMLEDEDPGAAAHQHQGTSSVPHQGQGASAVPHQRQRPSSVPHQGQRASSLLYQGQRVSFLPYQEQGASSLPHQGQGAVSLPSRGQPRPVPEGPQQSRSWEGLASDDFWTRVKDVRRMLSTKPKIRLPQPGRQRQRTAARSTIGTQRVSRLTQTMPLGIRKLPEAMTTFPVPWARRLRSVSVGTQTEDTTKGVVQGQLIASSWDPLPEEVFVMDEVAEWSTDSSFDNRRKTMSSSKFADNTFLELDLSDISLSALFDPGRSLPMQHREGASSSTTAQRHDTEVEVIDESLFLRIRTVATNTVFVGSRRPQMFQRSRILNRPIALGWNSNPDTATVATQTER